MNHTFALLNSILILAGTTAVLCSLVACSETEKPTSDQTLSRAIPARVIIVEAQPIEETYLATGTFNPFEKVSLTTEVSGRIEKIHFREGQMVRKGKLLIELTQDVLNNQLDGLKIDLNLANTEFKRAQKLLKSQAISQEEVDRLAFEIEKIKNQIASTRTQIDKRFLKAPFSGQIGFRMVSKGAYITAGEPIADLIDNRNLKLNFRIPEQYQTSIQEGKKIRIRTENSEFESEITEISPYIDEVTRTFQARAIIPNRGNILAGSYAEIELSVYKNDSAILVPSEAIIQKLGGEEVFKLSNGKAIAIPVKSGLRTEHHLEILKGIHIGDTVITSGLLSIKNGNRIEAEFSKLEGGDQ